MNLINNFKDVYTTIAGFGELIGVTRQRAGQLVKEGAFEKDDKHRIHVKSAIQSYISFRTQNKTEENYEKEKAKLTAAKRRLAELELEKEENKLHTSEDVEYCMAKMLTNIRSQFLGLSASLPPLLKDKRMEDMQEIILESVNDVLSELQNYDPEMFVDVEEAEE